MSTPAQPAGVGGEEGVGMEAGEVEGGWGGGEGGAVSWGGIAFDADCVNAFLPTALSRVMRANVPIPTVATASVLHSAAVGGFVVGDVGPL